MALMPNLVKLLLSPSGRIGRRDFLIGLAVFFIVTSVFNLILKQLDRSTFSFLISLPFPFLVLHMMYCLYGRRLHDIGRSFWPLTGMIVTLILIAIVVMLTFGGADYFAGFSEYDRNNPPPAELAERLQAEYQVELAKGSGWLYGGMCSVIGAFTLWLALAKPQIGSNQYGDQPKAPKSIFS